MKILSGYIRSIRELRKTRLRLGKLEGVVGALSSSAPVASSAVVTVREVVREIDKKNVLNYPKSKVLLCDDQHINQKNFPSLYKILSHKNVDVHVGVEKNSREHAYIDAAGDYEEFCVQNPVYLHLIKSLQKESLWQFRYKNIDIVDVSLDETVSRSITCRIWDDYIGQKDRRAIFDHLWVHDRDLLHKNCAAATFWADYWSKLDGINTYDAAIIFSGASIYARTLLELTRYTMAKTFVIESFMTGFDYFMEERSSPLPNASRISSENYFRLRQKHFIDEDHLERSKIRALNKVRTSKNKNVSQPKKIALNADLRSDNIVLVLGQVVNDYSLISGCGNVLVSLNEYRSLVEGLLVGDPTMHVVFKAHPWERKKSSLRQPYTLNRLEEWKSSLPEDIGSRLFLVEEVNLQSLLSVSKYVVTLCSQSAIEAAVEGFKPVVIGGAFYDGHKFTSNFANGADAAVALSSHAIRGTLSIDEWGSFLNFLAVLVEGHLLNNDDSGAKKVGELLTRYKPQKVAKSHQSEMNLGPTWDDAVSFGAECRVPICNSFENNQGDQ
ncbi:hypothetical protein PFY01_02485 [Brevundimonas vesicularis]|uniref:capsular polysaccharide export protein, LipB/KpsS family n=1 Tax=Brevundimonas vesicularis TaxID=41276 RepID=UPI0022EC81AF|nr:hypothetical protein [Brevundimonas vesicularis]WBT06563.1 hypothetical protein PFY01_02485 [Brevundimonas vesicularis]